jgi:hypothetical protein
MERITFDLGLGLRPVMWAKSVVSVWRSNGGVAASLPRSLDN